MDLSDREARLKLFDQLGREAKKALVICEGLMIYLSHEEVGALADDLAAQHHFRRWAFDLASPGLLQMAQKEMGSFFKAGEPVFKFAPEEGEGFYEHHGWKNIESGSKLKTAAHLKRLSPEMMYFAAIPEPDGPKGAFPWSGVCLFENRNNAAQTGS